MFSAPNISFSCGGDDSKLSLYDRSFFSLLLPAPSLFFFFLRHRFLSLSASCLLERRDSLKSKGEGKVFVEIPTGPVIVQHNPVIGEENCWMGRDNQIWGKDLRHQDARLRQ